MGAKSNGEHVTVMRELPVLNCSPHRGLGPQLQSTRTCTAARYLQPQPKIHLEISRRSDLRVKIAQVSKKRESDENRFSTVTTLTSGP